MLFQPEGHDSAGHNVLSRDHPHHGQPRGGGSVPRELSSDSVELPFAQLHIDGHGAFGVCALGCCGTREVHYIELGAFQLALKTAIDLLSVQRLKAVVFIIRSYSVGVSSEATVFKDSAFSCTHP